MPSLKCFCRALLLLVLGALPFNNLFGQCAYTGSATFTTGNTYNLNTYFPATTSVAAGSRVIAVGSYNTAGAATPIAGGDLVLIIQMQGSTINSTNTAAYGDGVAAVPASGLLTSVAGTYEYAIALRPLTTAGGNLYLSSPLVHAYTASAATATDGAYTYQVIRIPTYASMTFGGFLTAPGPITGAAWNGSSGGVIAFDATAISVVFTGTIVNASGIGFRGGVGLQLSGTAGFTNADIRTASTSNGSKGEGIAGTPRWRRVAGANVDAGSETYPNGSNGNGAPGNAGGGGTDGNPGVTNDQNSGGAGGANGGAGGRGGNSWSTNLPIGGYGGAVPSFLSATRLIMGGGGGAGTNNDGTGGGTPAGIASSGAAGGGIVMIRANTMAQTVLMTGTILANGAAAGNVVNDGAGGGGAGGTVYITKISTGAVPYTIDARGGNGGSANTSAAGAANSHGPGGGGGGGIIHSNRTIAASSLAFGTNGITTNAFLPVVPFGAEPGIAGPAPTVDATLSTTLPSPYCSTDFDGDGIPDLLEYRAALAGPFADTDSDGKLNAFDTDAAGSDTNGDGINDAYDADKDGIINSLDLDSDNDGITDVVEAAGTDATNDGLNDAGATLLRVDSDGDGIPNPIDLDSDNDGATDIVEAGGVEVDGDGRVEGFTDADGDGLTTLYDANNGGTAILNRNTDAPGDALPNRLDLDSDNDGIPDVIEAGGADGDNNGILDAWTGTTPDTDLDGLADLVDGDVGNDGTAENTAGARLTTSAANTAGVPTSYSRFNNDGTGLPNAYDLDSDGDGINDVREAGFADTDFNGVADGTPSPVTGWSPTIDALPSYILTDSDSDILFNFLDIDSDNDGITDNVEFQTSAGYVLPSGTDTDGDGIDNSYDDLAGFGETADIAPYNHDGTDLPDYLDTDTDNDTGLDIVEGNDFNDNGLPDDLVTLLGTDADGDGLDDRFDIFAGPNVTIVGYGGTGSGSTAQQTPTGATDRDWRNPIFNLPVNLISFSGTEKNDIVTLRWTVELEEAFKEYVIERSTDGNGFSVVGTVAARGLPQRQDYETTDDISSISSNNVYYRLKMVDIDGRFKYSASIRIVLDGNLSAGIRVTPNPVNAGMQLRIATEKEGLAAITIAHSNGQIIHQAKERVYPGENSFNMGMLASKIPAGTYMVRVWLDGKVYTTKFVK